MAMRLKKGYLALRKGGKLCVDTDKVQFNDYQAIAKELEIRTVPFPKGRHM